MWVCRGLPSAGRHGIALVRGDARRHEIAKDGSLS